MAQTIIKHEPRVKILSAFLAFLCHVSGYLHIFGAFVIILAGLSVAFVSTTAIRSGTKIPRFVVARHAVAILMLTFVISTIGVNCQNTNIQLHRTAFDISRHAQKHPFITERAYDEIRGETCSGLHIGDRPCSFFDQIPHGTWANPTWNVGKQAHL